MKTFRVLSICLAAVICAAGPVFSGATASRVCIRGACVAVETVRDEAARARGLMYRDRLEPGTGMLFVFDSPGRYAFWMMNMRFALDMIWISRNLRVAAVSENVPPCVPGGECESVSPDAESLYVLEVPAGFCRDHGVTAGDTVQIR